MTEQEAADAAVAIASALFPPPIGPAIGIVGPALPKLFALWKQLLGGADPDELRRAELPSDAAILTDTLRDLPPDTERP